MISPDYCVTMAHYNGWQNRQLKAALTTLDHAALTQDRGAFFGSILGTANHLLWGDRMWMARFAGIEPPDCGIPESPGLTGSVEEWALERFRTDSAMLLWAKGVRSVDLTGVMRWYSGALGHEVEKPLALCVMHMFNHQTHHRGQIHALLTQAGARAPVTDLPFMPAEGPWL